MRKLTALMAAGLVLGASGMAMADTNTASTTATATIVQAITIHKDADLSFGRIISSVDTADTVTIATGGGRTQSGIAVTLDGSSGYNAAAYTVTGTANTAYGITLPQNGTITIVGPSGSTAMAVNSFTSAYLTGGSSTTATIGVLSHGTSGTGVTQKFNVGATLSVAINQASGNYSGNFNASVDYN